MSDLIEGQEEAPVSLYIDLEPGRSPDLEVVARAALAFAGALRETAYIFDPAMAIRVELVSGTEGSLSLNSLVRSIRQHDLITRKRLIALAITGMIWFTHETGRWSLDEVLHFILGTQYAAHLSQDDVKEIVERVTEALEKRTAQPHVGQVYRELETDTAVRGVGATARAGTRPDRIVPRSEFAQRSGGTTSIIETSEIVRQTRRSHERVTVIRPVLESGRGSWQFSGSAGRFFAPIRDRRFLDDLLTGRIVVPMVAGIQIDVDLDTTEERDGDVWVVQDRSVIAVHQIHPPPTQGSLPLPMPRSGQSGAGDRGNDEEC